jgi:hypothetical protein
MDGIWRAASPGAWRSFSIVSTFVVLILGMFLMARCATGDVTSPLPLALLIPTAAILTAWGCLMRFGTGGLRASWFSFWLPSIAILLFAIGLSYPGPGVAHWFVWLAAYATLVLGPRWLAKVRHRIPAAARKRRGHRLIQDLRRYRTSEGRDIVRGTLAADFPPGKRTETLWVGFCPPFEFLPQVTVHATGDASASVKVAQVLHNGAQLEVRLSPLAGCSPDATIELVAAEPGSL